MPSLSGVFRLPGRGEQDQDEGRGQGWEDSGLRTAKKAIKIHQQWIFQPLHNEVKSVLNIKESYSMGKKS